jgi:hypothetical protein
MLTIIAEYARECLATDVASATPVAFCRSTRRDIDILDSAYPGEKASARSPGTAPAGGAKSGDFEPCRHLVRDVDSEVVRHRQ